MSESETHVLKRIQLALSRGPIRLFRNNVGQAWAGKLLWANPRRLIIDNPAPVHFGLATGSADLRGWKSIIITPDMVGKRVAVLASIEVKINKQTYRPEQKEWADTVSEAGGIAGLARSITDAAEILGAD